MVFNVHSRLEGKHAFLSASKYHWIRYDDDKLDASYLKHRATVKGTELHAFAQYAIQLGIKLPKTNKTLNMYINDAIGFKMEVEKVLYYSDNCFGTPDAISFRKNFLRIHDLKTGQSPASMDQLKVYAALFCLEYGFKPTDIEMELRIYQADRALIDLPTPDEIYTIMDTIIRFDRRIDEIKIGG